VPILDSQDLTDFSVHFRAAEIATNNWQLYLRFPHKYKTLFLFNYTALISYGEENELDMFEYLRVVSHAFCST
jgi:hypothetical protein